MNLPKNPQELPHKQRRLLPRVLPSERAKTYARSAAALVTRFAYFVYPDLAGAELEKKSSVGTFRDSKGRFVCRSGGGLPLEDCYSVALENGWNPRPLRKWWWQLWLPKKYDIELVRALKNYERNKRLEYV